MEGIGEGDILGLGSGPRGSVFSWFPAPLVLSLPTPMIFQARSKVTLAPSPLSFPTVYPSFSSFVSNLHLKLLLPGL